MQGAWLATGHARCTEGGIMNTRHLATFASVVEHGSFSKAAAALYTTPTSLTQQVNSLERALGFPLLARDYRGTVPTKGGEVFYHYAKEILRFVEVAEREAREAEGVGKQRVRIGTYRNFELILLRPALAALAELYPNIEVQGAVGDYRCFLDELLNGEIDLYIHPWGRELDRDDLGFRPLGETGLCCSMAFGHPLADGRELLVLDDLVDHDVIIGCGCSSHSLEKFHEALAPYGPRIKTHMFISEDEVWTHVLTQGYILVNMSYSAKCLAECVSIPLDLPETLEYGFVYRKPCSHALERLFECAEGRIGTA